jgi:hypothetical protein
MKNTLIKFFGITAISIFGLIFSSCFTLIDAVADASANAERQKKASYGFVFEDFEYKDDDNYYVDTSTDDYKIMSDIREINLLIAADFYYDEGLADRGSINGQRAVTGDRGNKPAICWDYAFNWAKEWNRSSYAQKWDATAFIVAVGRQNRFGGKIFYWDFDDKLGNRPYSSKFENLQFAENAGMHYEDISISKFNLNLQGFHFDDSVNGPDMYHVFVLITFNKDSWTTEKSLIVDPTWFDNTDGTSKYVDEQFIARLSLKEASNGSIIYEERLFELETVEIEENTRIVGTPYALVSGGVKDAYAAYLGGVSNEKLMDIIKNPKDYWGQMIYLQEDNYWGRIDIREESFETDMIVSLYSVESTYNTLTVPQFESIINEGWVIFIGKDGLFYKCSTKIQ